MSKSNTILIRKGRVARKTRITHREKRVPKPKNVGKIVKTKDEKEIFIPADRTPSARIGVKAPTALPAAPEQRHLPEKTEREWKVSKRTWKRDYLQKGLKYGLPLALGAISMYTTGEPTKGIAAARMLHEPVHEVSEWAGEKWGFGAGLLHPNHPARGGGGYVPQTTTRGLHTNPILPFQDHSYRW
jgi:hypothetical protein